MWPVYLLYAVVTLALTCCVSRKLRTVPLFFIFAFLIAAEDALHRRACLPSLRFPRSPAEVRDAPRRFFALLRDKPLVADGLPPLLPPGCRFAIALDLGEQTTEPAKNDTAMSLRYRFHASAEEEEELPGGETLKARDVDVFVKFQCGRGLKLWLQALRSAMAPGLAREVMFYQKLAHVVPQRVARPFFADAIHWCNRICIVLEHLGDATVVPDWSGGSEAQLKLVAVNVAAMHAKWSVMYIKMILQ